MQYAQMKRNSSGTVAFIELVFGRSSNSQRREFATFSVPTFHVCDTRDIDWALPMSIMAHGSPSDSCQASELASHILNGQCASTPFPE
jgi:hypothetical protein